MTNKTFGGILTSFCILRYYFVKQIGLGEIALPVVTVLLDFSIMALVSYNVFFRKYIMDYIDNSYPELSYDLHRFFNERLELSHDGKFKWVPKDTPIDYQFDEAIEFLIKANIVAEQEVTDSNFRCAVTQHVMQFPVRVLRACDIDASGQLHIDYKLTEGVHRFDGLAIADWMLNNRPYNPLNPDQKLRINYQEYGKQSDYKVGDVVPDVVQQEAIVEYIREKMNILKQQQEGMTGIDGEAVTHVASSSNAKRLYDTFTSGLRGTTRVDGVDLSTVRQRRPQG